MSEPLPKRYGKKLPLVIDNGERICFSVTIPDQVEYRAALMGQLNDMGFWFAWDHVQTDMYDVHERQTEAAQLWLNTIVDASFEVCMSFCEQLIACLTEDGDTQEALAELIRTNPAIGLALSDYMKTHPGGTALEKNRPLPTGVSEGNILGGNPDCDPDILYGQCLGIVQTANRMIEDFLQTWETYTNQGEVVSDIVNAVPLLAEVAQASGVTGIIEYANDLVDAIGENYLADYTLEYEIALACEIFCAAKATCAVSIGDLCNIMNTRIGNALNLANGVELMTSLMDQDITGFNVADLYLCAFVNMLNVANLVLPITWGIESFTTVIAAINEPNDDWRTECLDCPSEPRWPLAIGVPSSFPGLVLVFDGIDGDWDLWHTTAVNCPETIVMDNGQTYTHGYNVKRSDDMAFYIDDNVTDGGTAWCLWLNAVGALLNARHFPPITDPTVYIAQGNTTGNVLCHFKVRGV